MTVREVFQAQLEKNTIITAETLENIQTKCYRNGDPIIAGDQVVFGLFRSSVTDEVGNDSIYVTVYPIHVSHIDLYGFDPDRPYQPSDEMPWIIEKQ